MADEPMVGYSASWSALTAEQGAVHLGQILAQAGTCGLVEGLEAACWLRGQGVGTTQLYRLDRQTSNGTTHLLTAAELVAQWPQGRLFNLQVEWRWQQQADGSFHLLGLAEDRAQLQLWGADGSPAANGATTQQWRVRAGEQQLVGSTVEKRIVMAGASAWGEVRNPHPLLYPLEHQNDEQLQPRVRVRFYATANHVVRFTRFCQLKVGMGSGQART